MRVADLAHKCVIAAIAAIVLAGAGESWLLASQSDRPVNPSTRKYHVVSMDKLATTRWTHVCVTGPVVYRRKQQDGDWHVTLDDGKAKIVLEIIPLIPLPVPSKGQVVEACGISRVDPGHKTDGEGWPEVHPVEKIRVVK